MEQTNRRTTKITKSKVQAEKVGGKITESDKFYCTESDVNDRMPEVVAHSKSHRSSTRHTGAYITHYTHNDDTSSDRKNIW